MSTSAVAGRERRKTAGRRMNALVGKAQEDDDAFWGHDTWNDNDANSDNDSFRESDEDSKLAKDEFDSDFDDSEIDHEEEEAAAGEAEEVELHRSERAAKRRGGSYADNQVSAARGKKGSGRRIMGEGFNSGIVLNIPSQISDSLLLQQRQHSVAPATARPTSATISSTTAATSPTLTHFPEFRSSSTSVLKDAPLSPSKRPIRSDPVLPKSTNVSIRERRSTHGARQLRDTRSTPGKATQSSSSSRKGSNQPANKSAKRKRYTQEELLMEAIHETEPENRRWLFSRKRIQDQSEKDASTNALRDRQRGKIVQKFHSRRDSLITLTFPEMDAVPEFFTRKPQQKSLLQENMSSDNGRYEYGAGRSELHESYKIKGPTYCVITGKPAKYRDPLTKLPYFNLEAFKELRRLHNVGTSDENPKNDSTQDDAAGMKNNVTANEQQSFPKSLAPKKTARSNSKLPFQSPKPPQTTTAKKTSSSSSNASSIAQADQSLAHLAFTWNSVSSTESPTSPSGRRLSRRKWKPSEKVLEAIAMSPKKDGIISAPPGLLIKPEELSENLHVLPRATSTTSILHSAFTVSADTKVPINVQKTEKSEAGGESTSLLQNENGKCIFKAERKDTMVERKLVSTSTSKAGAREVGPLNAAAATNTTGVEITTPVQTEVVFGDKTTGKNSLKIPSPELVRQLKSLHTVSSNSRTKDCLASDGTKNGTSDQNHSRSITQGDLIDHVIRSYTQSQDIKKKQQHQTNTNHYTPPKAPSSQAEK